MLPILKMNFIFRIAAGLFLLAAMALLGGCAQRTEAPVARDGGDAQRLVSLVDYIAGDYPLAVRDGAVVSPAEYEEQLTFAGDARRLAAQLLGGQPSAAEPFLVHLTELDARVKARAPAAAVAAACRAA